MSEQTEAVPEKKPRVALWIATGFGLGYLPVAPGTWGSLAGIVIACVLSHFCFWIIALIAKVWEGFGIARPLFIVILAAPYVAVTALFSLLGVLAASKAADYFRKSDPQEVVVDEISGQMIALFPILVLGLFDGFSWKYVVVGFILFRVFDIWKPWPIRRLEKLPGGWGIMADDWMAGVYAAALLWLVRWQGWIG